MAALNIQNGGLALESSATAAEHLPLQAFAISLDDNAIEDMIQAIQSGRGIQLSLGNTPSFLFGEQEVRIRSSDPSEYDLFYSDSANPTHASRLKNSTMSIFDQPWAKRKLAKAANFIKTAAKPTERTAAKPTERATTKPTERAAAKPTERATTKPTERAAAKTTERATAKPSSSTPKYGSEGKNHDDDATVQLKNAMAKAEHEKLENSARLIDGVTTVKNGKIRATGKTRLLGSHPTSPALTGPRSPSLAPPSSNDSNKSPQDRAKMQRVPIIHELAVKPMAFGELSDKIKQLDHKGCDDSDCTEVHFDEGSFSAALNKVADFDDGLQKFVLKKIYWNELDVFRYRYAADDERQKAIENAVKQYDRRRLPASEPVWQKLLPVAERGKGICISNIQNKIAAAAAPKVSSQKDASSPSGDSEKDEAGSAPAKKKGGEAMARSGSQTKAAKNGTDAQMKRILSGGVKKTASKASPKIPPAKATQKATAPPKAGKVLSKEFVSDSSDDDEVPLAKSKAMAAASVSAAAARLSEKTRSSNDTAREASTPKAKPVVKATAVRDDEKEKRREKDTIEAFARASKTSTAAPNKRPRDEEEDSSSSSGPLSKRVKPKESQPQASAPAKASIPARDNQLAAAPSQRRQVSTASSVGQKQPARASEGQKTVGKAKATTSPPKSSPLASSPPTNASDLAQERALALEREKEKERARERERERERQQRVLADRERVRQRQHDRETVVSSSSSHGGNSSVSSRDSAALDPAPVAGKKRKVGSDEGSTADSTSKRQCTVSAAVLSKANKFKQFYSRYEALHMEIAGLEDPPDDKMADLLEMRDRLSKMKSEIYREVSER